MAASPNSDPMEAIKAPMLARLKEIEADERNADKLRQEIEERQAKVKNLSTSAQEAKKIRRALAALDSTTGTQSMSAEEEEEARKRIKEVVTKKMSVSEIGHALNIDGRKVRRLARALTEQNELTASDNYKSFGPAKQAA